MGQTSGSDRNYIYKDKSERYRYMNTFYIFAVVILWVLFGVYLLAKLASKSIAVGTAVGNVVLIILFAVVELAFYLRNKSFVISGIWSTISSFSSFLGAASIVIDLIKEFISYVS